MVRVVEKNRRGAKKARLSYEVVDMAGELSLVRIQLHTGRPHQIRVQMAQAGHPLFGDQRYGKRIIRRQQIALWAERIGFLHPTTKEFLEFKEPPPTVQPWSGFRHYQS